MNTKKNKKLSFAKFKAEKKNKKEKMIAKGKRKHLKTVAWLNKGA